MQLITDILVGSLTAYLAFTNLLALQIMNWLDYSLVEESPVELVNTDVPTFSNLPTQYQTGIPSILRDSAAYQQAAILTSNNEIVVATTEDPLEALVNIYCTFTTSTHIRTTTGTGFFINNNGVILTNAHVAQFLLLEETDALGDADCLIRTGNPAAPRYRAELLYIPPAWVKEHAAMIDAAAPTGTGERDYALLYVTERVDSEPLPASFPNLIANTELLPRTAKGTAVTAAGYPAESLLNGDMTSDLIPKSANTLLTELYTFGSNYADVISIQGSAIGEHGSSGGPIVDEAGDVIGIITTRGDDELDGAGSLRAITLSHINRTIEEETGYSFNQNITGNVAYRGQVFTDTMAPFLTRLLTAEVN